MNLKRRGNSFQIVSLEPELGESKPVSAFWLGIPAIVHELLPLTLRHEVV